MWRVGWVVVVTVAAACAPTRELEVASIDSQSVYSSPGCASGALLCPQDVTLLCAIHLLQSQYAECRVDADCTLVELPNACYATGDCPQIAVAAQHATTFTVEATAEIEAYCASPDCQGPTTCDLDPEAVRAACVEGACVSEVQEVEP